MAKARLGIVMNLKLNAHTQYSGFDFNSMAVFVGKQIAVNEDGLFSLDDAQTDAGTEIEAICELVCTDFGVRNAKRIRRVDVGYESQGNLILGTYADGGTENEYLLHPQKSLMRQHRVNVNHASASVKGVYWTVRIRNRKGCDFSLDAIDVLSVVLDRKR